MQVVNLPIDQVKPYWRNPRNNEPAVEAVKQSIQQYGFNSPIVVDKDYVIIVGHTRLRALRELGYTDIPCIVKDLSADKAKAYRIADNKTSEFATWDYDKLVQELRELDNLTSMEIFFPDMDLSGFIGETAGVVNFDAPTQEAIDKKQGDLDARFDTDAEARASAEIEVICPHCAQEFFVQGADILRRMNTTSHKVEQLAT